MFENVINPSAEGSWSRVAPYLTMFAIVVSFCLALMVVVSAIQTGHYLTTKVPKDVPAAEGSVIVQKVIDVRFGG
jgi:hypothetical protein